MTITAVVGISRVTVIMRSSRSVHPKNKAAGGLIIVATRLEPGGCKLDLT
jgi:hypothetical protein